MATARNERQSSYGGALSATDKFDGRGDVEQRIRRSRQRGGAVDDHAAVGQRMTVEAAWETENQRYLVAALARIRRRLEQLGAGSEVVEDNRGPESEAAGACAALARPPAAALLAESFGLSSFERELLLISAGPEFSSSFAEVCARARGLPGRAAATFGLALGALEAPHWSALRPEAPLRRHGLLLIHPSETLVEASLSVDEPVLHFLAGSPWFDERFEALATRVVATELVPSHRAIQRRLKARLATQKGSVVLAMRGRLDDVRAVAAAMVARPRPLPVLNAADIPTSPIERQPLARWLRREQALGAGAVLVDATECAAANARVAFELARASGGLTFLHLTDAAAFHGHTGLRVEVGPPRPSEQGAWRSGA